MKPSIPEQGTVLSIEGENAVIMLKGGSACNGCGAGKIGLCKPAGNQMFLKAKNGLHAKVGDTVVIGLDRNSQVKADLFGYIIPLVSLLVGSFGGHLLDIHFHTFFLDVLSGFLMLAAGSVYSFRMLRQLDRARKMVVKKVVSELFFQPDQESDEVRLYSSYADRC